MICCTIQETTPCLFNASSQCPIPQPASDPPLHVAGAASKDNRRAARRRAARPCAKPLSTCRLSATLHSSSVKAAARKKAASRTLASGGVRYGFSPRRAAGRRTRVTMLCLMQSGSTGESTYRLLVYWGLRAHRHYLSSVLASRSVV